MIWVLLSHRWRNLYSSTRFLLSFFHSSSTPQPTSSHPKILTLAPLIPHPNSVPTFPYSTTRSRRTPRSKRSKRAPPPVDQGQLDRAISELPARFTSADLAAALARHPDPRLCHELLLAALRHPRFRRPAAAANDDDDHLSPFLITIKKLGAARLYREMDAIASLALSLPSLPLSEPFFNTIIYFYAEARMLSKAIYVYKRMRAAGDPAVHPTTRTYNLLFAALLGRGANSYIHHVYMDSIRALFRQMLDSGVAPDVFALNSLIKGYASSLHLNDALRVFHQMVPVYGVEPDENTYSYLIHGLCAQGRTRNAGELWAEMRGKGLAPSGRAANSIVSALAMAGEVAEAVKIMWEVAWIGRAVDGITCRTLLEEICRQGRVGDAVRLLREMHEKELVDGRMYRELLHGIQDEFGDSLHGGN
ncbi:pentatricopeptide repeat-containing protein, mitochondrial [Cocos nucifera]|uniref:Pentatricopeptide repeat-containing protein, mitochondrial n=1 Tax=Cocos nucifera TaxID=13894 RepID=A0A8K0N2H6_COCNU|nr:pentatricopeptide repeat-containing protein, mitochondrial [Cocos nucifera]